MVRVNHAVALAENGLLAAALATLNELREPLADFQPFHAAHAAHAAVLAQAGQTDAARSAYASAIALASNESDRRFLAGRVARLGGAGGNAKSAQRVCKILCKRTIPLGRWPRSP